MEYTITLSLIFVLPQEDPSLGHKFPIIIDTLLDVFRSIPITQTLNDPDTGALSFLEMIGESNQFSYGDPVRTADQRLLIFSGRISLEVSERIAA